MEKNIIVAEMVQSNKSNNLVWHVHVTGIDNPELEGYCKQALAALRLAFVIKSRSGFNISDSVLQRLKELHSLSKQPKPEDTQVTVPEVTTEDEEKPKRKTRRTKKEKAAA